MWNQCVNVTLCGILPFSIATNHKVQITHDEPSHHTRSVAILDDQVWVEHEKVQIIPSTRDEVDEHVSPSTRVKVLQFRSLAFQNILAV